MILHKVVCLHLAGLLLIQLCVARDIYLGEGRSVGRLLQSVNQNQTQYRAKKLSQPIEGSSTSAPDDDDDKKTLAQQVADGKYGLIQKELFARPVDRPGILSYEINPEVPRDNVNNLGGLQPEEIWLAENHLLVLKGGGFEGKDKEKEKGKSSWPPIDNYIAPRRQVKIPPNPKVPPPFPIQLKDGGPIEFIRGANGSGRPPFFDPRFGPPPFFQQDGVKGNIPVQGNFTEGNGPFPFPFPPPGIGFFPPATAFLPPPGNFTELDEDDPSIYYPPPYDFVYKKDNSSFVPPGPLVPGIILPPPPDFFAPFTNKTKSRLTNKQSTTRKPTKRPYIERIKTTSKPIYKPTNPPTVTIYTTDNIRNEIQPPRTLPPDTPVGDWVPIPAPRPFYISEGIKTTKGNKYELPKNGWIYDNSTKVPLNVRKPFIDPLTGWNQGYNYKENKRPFTTQSPFKPIYVTQNIFTTLRPEKDYIKTSKDIYFYEEPATDSKLQELKYETTKPTVKYYEYETNTLAPPLYEQVTIKTQSESGRVNPYKYYTSTPTPELYYKSTVEAQQAPYSYPTPTLTHSTEPYKSNSKSKTTSKPPVYEFSYSAPGYGSVEAPKVGINYVTPKSVIFESNFTPAKEKPYSYFGFINSPKTQNYNYESTTRPSYYATRQPEYLKAFTTQTPYSIYQHDVGILDDITKKYFSLFGQKINAENLNEPLTTPLPPIQNQYYDVTEEKKNVKFPDEIYDVQNDQYYNKPVRILNNYRTPARHKPEQYPNYYRISSPQYSNYEYDQGIVRPGHSLASDINVNYKTSSLVRPGHSLDSDLDVNYKNPPTKLEPDAEFISPSYVRQRPGNSFISYQLPGSGGHFYFLTPQAVKNENYQQNPDYYDYDRGYYKRNTRSKPSRQQRTKTT